MRDIIEKLEKHRQEQMETEERPSKDGIKFYNIDRVGGFSAVMYVPHEENYQDMLSKLKKDDVLCDMGAGDLRFGLMACEKCRKVYAVELSPMILSAALRIIGYLIPRNLIPVCADWRYFRIPDEVTVVSCLVNIREDDLPINYWKENNRRVYFGVVGSDEDEPLMQL